MSLHESKYGVIRTSWDYPPIPSREVDWSAYLDGKYDGAPDAGFQPVGYGRTEEAAIADLLAMLEDESEEERFPYG
jgi:hypothetical protein